MDYDIQTLFKNRKFTDRLVNTLDPKAKTFYEKELKKTTNDRLRKERLDELNRKRFRDEWNQKQLAKDRLFGRIIAFIWIAYIIYACINLLCFLFGEPTAEVFKETLMFKETIIRIMFGSIPFIALTLMFAIIMDE